MVQIYLRNTNFYFSFLQKYGLYWALCTKLKLKTLTISSKCVKLIKRWNVRTETNNLPVRVNYKEFTKYELSRSSRWSYPYQAVRYHVYNTTHPFMQQLEASYHAVASRTMFKLNQQLFPYGSLVHKVRFYVTYDAQLWAQAKAVRSRAPHTRKSSQFKKKYKIFWKSQFKAASDFLWSLSKGHNMTAEGDICWIETSTYIAIK